MKIYFFLGSLSQENFELLCKDGSRRPISEYLACNWGKVPSDAIVVSSAVSFEDRVKLQKFLQKFAERYPKLNRNSTQSSFYGNNNNNPKPYDQSTQSNFDYNAQSNNRFKRQTDYNQYGRNDQNPYNRNNNNNPNDPYNTRTGDDYNRNNNPYNNDFNNQNGINQNQNPNDQFNRDPYHINPNQYGENIDPYGNPNENRNVNPFNVNTFGSNENPYSDYNRTNVTYFEVFDLFESSPRYGIHLNLMLQVIIK